MSLAEIFDGTISINPCIDGSFVAYTGRNGEAHGFTNVSDMLAWLQRAAKARQPVDVLDVAEPLVTRTVTSQVKAWPVHEGGEQGYATRLTTAAAERILGSTGDKPAA